MTPTLKEKCLDMDSPHDLDSRPACTSSQLCGLCVYMYTKVLEQGFLSDVKVVGVIWI